MGTNQLVIDRRLPPLVRAMMNPDFFADVNHFEPVVGIPAGFHLVADSPCSTAEAAAFVEREIDRLSRQRIAGDSH